MTRILGLIIVVLLALCIGLSAALFKTGQDARRDIMKLSRDLHIRTVFDGPRGKDGPDDRDGNRAEGNRAGAGAGAGEGENPTGRKGVGSFKDVRDRLGLDQDQAKMLRQFLKSRRTLRQTSVEALQESAADFRAAVTAETFDRAAVKALREGLITARRDESEAAFEGLLDFVETLSVEQREALLELVENRPNSLLFL
ncbi:MAG: periplasmic heavy metal sensor [Pseudomonadota bacterium]|nr:periplasmic heavy metal sensor [Pseudomonadota bacterium]